MIGTVVFVLYMPKYEGGCLLVEHGGVQVKKLKYPKVEGWSKPLLEWAAFFSDCVHEVKPVVSGTRVSITCLLVLHQDPKDTQTNDRLEQAREVETASPFNSDERLQSCLNKAVSALDEYWQHLEHNEYVDDEEEEQNSRDQVRLGVLLSHTYTHQGCSLQTLKGTDRLLIESLMKKWGITKCTSLSCPLFGSEEKNLLSDQTDRLRVVLMPIVYDCFRNLGRYYGGSNRYKDAVYAFTQEELLYLLAKGPVPVARKGVYPMHVPFLAAQLGKKLRSYEAKGAEHTGNESAPDRVDNMYFNAAAIFYRVRGSSVATSPAKADQDTTHGDAGGDEVKPGTGPKQDTIHDSDDGGEKESVAKKQKL